MNKTKYITVYDDLKNKIITGIYTYGDKIPSKREAADHYKVSLITVEQAYRILIDEGYIHASERSGYYVIYRTGEIFTAENDMVIPVRQAVSETDDEYISASQLARTMRRVISVYQEELLQKSPNTGCMILKNAIRTYLARSRDIIVSAQQIIIGAGAEYLYGMIVQYLGMDKIYAMEDPSYSQIREVYRAYGVKAIPLPMGNDGILSSALKNTHADVLHVTPYNSYPSGISASASKKREYLQWAEAHHAHIIEDDFDSEFTLSTKAEDTLYHLEPDHSVFYMNTFTQSVSPSIRAGYMLLPKEHTDAYNKKLGFYSCPVPVFEQYVIAELITSGIFERHINRVRRLRRRGSAV